MTADLSDNLFTQSINKRVLFAKTKGTRQSCLSQSVAQVVKASSSAHEIK